MQFILRFHDLCGVMALRPVGALFLWWGGGVPARYWHRGRNISCADLTGLLLLLQCFLVNFGLLGGIISARMRRCGWPKMFV